MKSQTEEMLWIATQEDHIIPLDIVKYAISKRISLSQLLDYSVDDFEGVDARTVRRFFNNTKNINEKKYRHIWDTVQKERVSLISYDDIYFPPQLKSVESNTSVLLYHKGLRLPFKKCIGIVGTRNCSTEAAEFTRKLSMEVANQDYVVVAGMALGIDTVAHRGALSVGGKTIAVLAWMHHPSPTSNYRLYDEIIKNGFVISDTFFNNEGMMARSKFVHRNEIISGISDYLIAVESGATGGTTHQVEFALRQKRIVITLEPQRDNEEAYRGFEKFVDKGALPVKSVDDVLNIIDKKRVPKPKTKTTLLEFK